MSKPTFDERARTVEHLIRSCENREQIEFCRQAIRLFVYPRDGETIPASAEVSIGARIRIAFEEMENEITS